MERISSPLSETVFGWPKAPRTPCGTRPYARRGTTQQLPGASEKPPGSGPSSGAESGDGGDPAFRTPNTHRDSVRQSVWPRGKRGHERKRGITGRGGGGHFCSSGSFRITMHCRARSFSRTKLEYKRNCREGRLNNPQDRIRNEEEEKRERDEAVSRKEKQPRAAHISWAYGRADRTTRHSSPRRDFNINQADDESASDEEVVVVFDSSSEEDSDDVFTGSDSEEEESSDDTMASAREWYRIDPDSIPARPPRFEFKGSPGVTITVSSPPQPLELF
ncbi:hypothetical protein HPB50_001168 [Hyalomma asiaticum]|uniref:Uncharacterized protein n=1 Tax=Hyalomma asiaticum TaxID=266040 RepID=A0ACB7T920_HYAAI|nr:hypothetical protein HPB50_001168 [Hyalomma asiaticum]